jgi:hypothetical protein
LEFLQEKENEERGAKRNAAVLFSCVLPESLLFLK